MYTRPLAARGAPVMVYAWAWSTVTVSHATAPVFASRATRRPSITPTNTLPPYSATPRLTTSQHAFGPTSRLTFGSYDHSFLPLRAPIAWTMLQAEVMYM